NTAIFSLVDRVILRPIPYPDSHRIVNVYAMSDDDRRTVLSPPTYLDFKNQATSYSSLAAFRETPFNLTANDLPRRINGTVVTPDFFDVMGVKPLLGRTLTPALDSPGGSATIVISFSLWQRLFAGDADVLGRTIQIDGEPRTVVGVMPRHFAFPPN